MSRRFTSLFELLLIAIVCVSLGLGVSWTGNAGSVTPITAEATPTVLPVAQAPQQVVKATVVSATTVATQAPVAQPTAKAKATTLPAVSTELPLTGTIGPIPTSAVMSAKVAIEPGDAPLLVQATGTMNILLLGVDASADERYSRTDTI